MTISEENAKKNISRQENLYLLFFFNLLPGAVGGVMGPLGDFARFRDGVVWRLASIFRLADDYCWRRAWQWNILRGEGSRIQLQEMIQTDKTAGVTDANTSYFIKRLKIYKIKKEPRKSQNKSHLGCCCCLGFWRRSCCFCRFLGWRST